MESLHRRRSEDMAHPALCIILASAALFSAFPAGAVAPSGSEARIVLTPEERQMNLIRSGISELLAGDWGDVAFLDKALSVRLEDRGDLPGSNARIWASEGGWLYGFTLRRIELVASKDDPSPQVLILDLAEPGPDGRKLTARFWPDAEYTPPHPDARDAPGLWQIDGKGYTLFFVHKRDSMQVTGISLSRN